jgi:hypothetical protein
VAGPVINFDETGAEQLIPNANLDLNGFFFDRVYHQPGVWMRRDHLAALGGFDASFRYVFDAALTARYLGRFDRVAYVQTPLVRFREHGASKTISEGARFDREYARMLTSLANSAPEPNVRAISRRALELRNWRRRVEAAIRMGRRHRLAAATSILGEAVRRPAGRLTRFTLGAGRRLIGG